MERKRLNRMYKIENLLMIKRNNLIKKAKKEKLQRRGNLMKKMEFPTNLRDKFNQSSKAKLPMKKNKERIQAHKKKGKRKLKGTRKHKGKRKEKRKQKRKQRKKMNNHHKKNRMVDNPITMSQHNRQNEVSVLI